MQVSRGPQEEGREGQTSSLKIALPMKPARRPKSVPEGYAMVMA
jgi:hypothetical protein